MQSMKNVLLNEYQTRKNKNSQYSLRSFAQQLNLSPATLSMVLSGKRKLSRDKIIDISKQIGLSPASVHNLLEKEILNIETDPKNQTSSAQNIQLKEEQFQLISNWHHYAIISLSKLKKHKADTRWISKHLGISEIDAREALNRLLDLKLIEIQHDKIVELNQSTTTTEDIPSEAIRHFHKGVIHKALESIDQVSPEQRELSTIVLSFNKKDIKSAKKFLRDYQEKFANQFESEKSSDEVYAISLQFFPLTNIQNEVNSRRDI
jgi:uncharacterized protein (TIGR02147 family)